MARSGLLFPNSTGASHFNLFHLVPFLLVIASIFSSLVYSQQNQLVPTSPSSQFPACGVSCAVLQQAQGSCEANQGNRQTLVSCFCQSALLINLKQANGQNGPCNNECTNPSDRSLVSSWYMNFCSNGGNLPQTNGPATTTAAAPTNTGTNPASTTTGSSQNDGATPMNPDDDYDHSKPWYVASISLYMSIPD